MTREFPIQNRVAFEATLRVSKGEPVAQFYKILRTFK